MFIPDPDFFPSRILDLASPIQQHQKIGKRNKKLLSYIFCSYKFLRKIENYFIFEHVQKKIESVDNELKKILLSCQKYGLGTRDPGIGKKLISEPGSGFRVRKSIGSRIRIPDTDVWSNCDLSLLMYCRLPQGCRKKLVPYPGSGSRVQKSTGSRILIPDNSELY